MRRLRIGLICHDTVRNNQRLVVRNITALLSSDYDFCFVTSDKAPVEATLTTRRLEVPLPRLDIYSCRYISRATKKLVRDFDPDILICVSHPFPLGFATVLLRPRGRAKLILRMTGDQFEERKIHSSPLTRFRKVIMHEMLMPRVLSRADLLLCVGQRLANQLLDRKITPKIVKVMPQPFDASQIAELSVCDRAKVRSELGIQESDIMVLSVGTHSVGKGYDRFPDFIKLTQKAKKTIKFVTVGDGPLRSVLSSMEHERLTVIGSLTREDVVSLMKAADILLHPTRRDALPNVVLEALALGVPIVSTPVGEIPSYITNIGVTNTDLVELLLSEDLVVDRLPEAFSWEGQQNAYREIIEGTLAV